MALSASLAVSQTVSVSGQPIGVAFTVSNPAGGSAVAVVRVTPYMLNSGGSAVIGEPGRQPAIPGTSNLTSPTAALAASIQFNWKACPFVPPAPLNPPYPSTPTYDTITIGAVAELSDGTTVTASTTIYVYPLTASSTGALTFSPGYYNGRLNLDLNLESALLAAAAAPPFFMH